MRKPYIGITGFMSADEVQSVLDALPADSDRMVMVGVLASLKTMRGIRNKWPNRYPPRERMADIFSVHPHALNLVHYNTKEEGTLFFQLWDIANFCGQNMHGFQLNIAWPSLDALFKYRENSTKLIVLQIGGRAFEEVNHSSSQLAARVAPYKEVCDYVLLDPSGGLGIPFDPDRIRNYLLALKSCDLNNMGLGVAGGLSPATLHNIAPLAREFPDLSIDAEGRLRTADDHLDIAIAKEYLRKASVLFTSAAQNRA